MIRISEFTPAITSKKECANSANCHVIINNSPSEKNRDSSGSRGLQKQDVSYPTVSNEIETDEIAEPKYVSPLRDREKELFRHLAISFSNILKTNNPKLIANIIDMSGKVILSADDLCTAVALICDVERGNVRISYEDPEVGCLGSVNPVKRIISIKVNGYDFNYGFNRQYNSLSDEFSVSLTKAII